MKILLALPSNEVMEEVLWSVCNCEELSTPVRKMEKKVLNELLTKVRRRRKKQGSSGDSSSSSSSSSSVRKKRMRRLSLPP